MPSSFKINSGLRKHLGCYESVSRNSMLGASKLYWHNIHGSYSKAFVTLTGCRGDTPISLWPIVWNILVWLTFPIFLCANFTEGRWAKYLPSAAKCTIMLITSNENWYALLTVLCFTMPHRAAKEQPFYVLFLLPIAHPILSIIHFQCWLTMLALPR